MIKVLCHLVSGHMMGEFLVEDLIFTTFHYCWYVSLNSQLRFRLELWIKSLDDCPNYEQSSIFVGFALILDYNKSDRRRERKDNLIWLILRPQSLTINHPFLSEQYTGQSSIKLITSISWCVFVNHISITFPCYRDVWSLIFQLAIKFK